MGGTSRLFIFYGVFVFLLIAYAAIVGGYLFGISSVSVAILSLIVLSAPVITHDISYVGEYTPPVLAALMAACAPPPSERSLFTVAIILAVIAYFAFVHLTVFFDQNSGRTLLEIAGADPDTIKTFAASVRTFCIVVAAGILGLKLNPQPKG